MTGNRCLLDTSIIIHAFRKYNDISEKLDNIPHVYISVTAVGELYFGAYKSADSGKHIQRIQSFLNNCFIIETDETTAIIYGKIKANLSQKGKPIPENDIWIGATAIQYELPLFTTDSHFREIDNPQLF